MADDSWRTATFRQSVVSKIDEAIRQSRMPTSRNSMEMENHVFQKAKTKEEYLGFVARLILHVREMNCKSNGKPPVEMHLTTMDPMNIEWEGSSSAIQPHELTCNIFLEANNVHQECSKRPSGAARRRVKKEAGAERQGQPASAGMSENSVPVALELQELVKRYNGHPRVSEETTGAFKLAIIDMNYPKVKFNVEQSQTIQEALLDAIDKTADLELEPKFQDCRFQGGALIITCAEEETRFWLEIAINRCVLWEGASLKIVDAKILSKPIKTTVWIPGSLVEPETLLSRLQIQNRSLNTEEWDIVDRQVENDGQLLIIAMDEDSLKDLSELQFKPYLNFGQVTFIVLKSENREAQELPATASSEKCLVVVKEENPD